MALGTQNDVSMHSGDSLTLEITVNDASGSAVNVSSATASWALSKKATDSTAPRGAALVTKSATIIDGPTGRVDVVLDPADTDALAGTYYHELQVTVDGNVSTVLYGSITIAKDLV